MKKGKLLINLNFQLRFLLFTTIFALVAIGLFEIFMLYFNHKLESEGILLGLTHDHIYFQYIKDQRNFLHFVSLLFSLSILVLMSILSFFLSHKVVTPINRLTQNLIQISKGKNFKPIENKKSDFFNDLTTQFNKTGEKYFTKK